MTKNITKIIAGLGIVAGLGIAALPLSTYAATNSSNIPIEVTINATVGTVLPDCKDSGVAGNGEAGAAIAAAKCTVEGESNVGITMTLANANGYSELRHNDYPTNTSTIPGIPATGLNTAAFNALANTTGGYGFSFALGAGSVNFGINGTLEYVNGLVTTPTTLATSTASGAAAKVEGAEITFRAITPPSQATGVYRGAATLTVATI